MKLQNQQNIIDSHTQKLEQVQPLLDLTNAKALDLNNLKRFNDLLIRSETEEYSQFTSKIYDIVTQEIRKEAESKGISLEEVWIQHLKANLDSLRGDKKKSS